MAANDTTLPPEPPDNPNDPNTPSSDPRLNQVMTQPPSLEDNIGLRVDNPEFHRVVTPAQEAQLAQPAPGSTPQPVARTRQFGAKVVAPNEFTITHKGVDLGGKILYPTEVGIVLGWLNSLPEE